MIDPQNPDYTNTPVSPQRPHYSYRPAINSCEPSVVSVVIPCYNPPVSLFQQTIQSIRRSSFQNFTLVVVNDGSTDYDFLQALDELRLAEPQMVVIDQENRGLPAARNVGVSHSHTPYFLQIDADDLIEPTFMEKCLWALESYSQFSFCNSFRTGFEARTYLWNRGFDDREIFLVQNQVAPTALVRRTAHLEIGGYDEDIRKGLEDWDYWLKMAASGFWGMTIPEYLIWYRHRQQP
jgi:glycosyltransferase involved in cell wall biosynthesis